MKNFILLLVFGSLLVLLSCSKNEQVNETSKESLLESKAVSVATLPLAWLETFRLRLLDPNAQYSYLVDDTEYGVEAIFNLLAAKGASQITNQKIYKSEITLPLTNGALTQTEISSLAEQVYQSVKNYAFKSSPGLLLVDLSSKTIGNSVKFTIASYTGNLTNPNYATGAGFECVEEAFDTTDCFRSAIGDLDTPYSTINSGGPCDSPNNLTSAQEEVQSVILNDIPRYIYGRKNQVIGKYVYTNPDCSDIYELSSGVINESLNKFSNCTAINLDYNDDLDDLQQIEYNGEELNCTVCALKDFLKSVCPPGKAVCDVNIWGDLLVGSSSKVKWRVAVCFCDVKVVSFEGIQQTVPDTLMVPAIDSILGSASILNF